MVEAVVLDAGEVLLRMPPWPDRVEQALLGLGLTLPRDRIERAVAVGDAWRARHVNQDLLPDWRAEDRHVLQFLRVVAQSLGLTANEAGYLRDTCHYVAATSVFPDVPAALAALRGLGLRIGLVSNAPPSMRAVLVSRQLMPYLDAVTLSCDVGATKPDPVVYRAALQRLGLAAEACAFADDLTANVDSARALGFARCVVVDRDGHAPHRSDRIPDLLALSALLASESPVAAAIR
jgi:HAD superfamily hydrolase (TIGR01509 family)